MKKQHILLAGALFIAVLSMTACGGGKNCKGGGWYGDRNLTSTDIKKSSSDYNSTKEIDTTNGAEVSP